MLPTRLFSNDHTVHTKTLRFSAVKNCFTGKICSQNLKKFPATKVAARLIFWMKWRVATSENIYAWSCCIESFLGSEQVNLKHDLILPETNLPNLIWRGLKPDSTWTEKNLTCSPESTQVLWYIKKILEFHVSIWPQTNWWIWFFFSHQLIFLNYR